MAISSRESAARSGILLTGYARVAVIVCLVHLAVGASFGGLLMLLRIIRMETLQAVPRVWVEAHANSQIVGAAGLAVIALAGSILPAVKRRAMAYENRMALAVSCVAAGSLIHGFAHTFQESLWPDHLLLASLTASFVQLVGWGYFVVVLYLYVRRLPEEEQRRFEKCVVIGAVWFGVGMAMVVMVRVMWLANVWVVSIQPTMNYGLRHLQLMTGAFLMVVGLGQPVFRGWPKDSEWLPRLLPQSLLWAATLAAFLVSLASPWAGFGGPAWIPGALVAVALLDLVAVGAYLVSLTRLAGTARERKMSAVSPWQGAWVGPSIWLVVSTVGNAGLLLWMARRASSAPDAWFHIVIHAFAVGYLLPAGILIFRHFGLLWRQPWVSPALWVLNVGLAMLVAGYPWMLASPHSAVRWLVCAGGTLEGAALLVLVLTGFADLFSEAERDH